MSKRSFYKQIWVFFFVVFVPLRFLGATSEGGVFFSKGLLHFSDQNYGLASQYFEKAYQQNKENEDVLYFLALTEVKKGDPQKGLSLFKELLLKNPKHPLAREWVERLESGSTQKVTKKWSLAAATALLFDSNATLDPDNENLAAFNNNQSDLMTATSLNASYRLKKTSASEIGARYKGYQSVYGNVNFDVDKLNFGRHQAEVSYRWQPAADISWRIPIQYTFSTLGKAKYFHGGGGQLIFDKEWQKKSMSRFFGEIRWDEFFAIPSNKAQVRDAIKASFGVEQYFFSSTKKDLFVKGGYTFEHNFAQGSDWDYSAHRVLLGTQIPLPYSLKLAQHNDLVLRREFEYVDSVFSNRRHDFVYSGFLELSRPIYRFLTAAISYSFILSDSNIRRYRYHRHLAGFALSTEF